MTKSFECSDAGVPCKAKVTGETEEEVLAKAVEHAKEAHGVDLSQSKTLAGYARSLIRDDGAGESPDEGVGEPREEAVAGAP